MLRSLFSNVSGFAGRKAIRCMSSSSPRQNTQNLKSNGILLENLCVRLCGTIMKNPTEGSNYGILLPISTQNANEKCRTKHRVFISQKFMKNQSVGQLTEGLRIYIIGRIGYRDVQSAEGLRMKDAHIQSLMILPCVEDEDPSSDINEVKCFGQVKSKPLIEESSTCLDVACEYFDRKPQSYRTNSHRVMILDDKMRQLANDVDVDASVFLRGFLNSEEFCDASGVTRLMYDIRPTKFIVAEPNAKFDLGLY